ncbi:B12-binding domain-containing protein [Acetobacterium carbinolicum]|jgi:methanogenic corrinoid protein MtbC1|uniref:cobalamin B12-binding domain-containing protein n=1 Tax=Acetobacterium TaxID=33951 RepID=UPI000DBECD7A|nr:MULTISPECIES: cobalamin-dependent protein [unclassified Acetobacterium]AWW28301.1 cobalamin-binding protein [Acetobacterium sp. KB-1]MDZ5725042.1 cobalamin-dependent protein [Acetobacterium sp. K1/6]
MLDLKVLTQAVGDLEEEQVMDILKEFIDSNPSEPEAQEAIAACQSGMAVVGDLFEKGEYFVGDLIFAGELLTESINVLKPVLGSGETVVAGTIILGTVHGDLHDIGKNIFKSMSEAAGFEVIDLGIDVAPELFVKTAKENKGCIIGMSGVLTLAIDAMKETIELIKVEGIDSKIIIGGNPVTKESCEIVGADQYTTNAAEGVKICQGWVA